MWTKLYSKATAEGHTSPSALAGKEDVLMTMRRIMGIIYKTAGHASVTIHSS